MAYLGNTPAARFSAMQYQDFTGVTGSPTAKRDFTLNHAVGNENEIEVFVNNVRQEPSVAYTVSGTSLTMTGDVETTDDFYVVFQGLAQQTVSHPSGNALQATTGAFSGAITANSGLNVGTIKEVTGTTSALTIDSSGRILTPARPAFKVRRTDSSGTGVTGQVNFNAVDSNVGSHYDTSSYHFLVPITGLYCFQFNGYSSSSSGGGNAASQGVQVEIQKSSASNFSSDTVIGHSYGAVTSSASHQNLNITCIEELTAGHYVRLFVAVGHIYSDAGANQEFDPIFSGFLVG
jgi:hypothetical protein